MKTEEELTKILSKKVQEHVEDLITEGLNRKGFVFNEEEKLFEFAANNITAKSTILKTHYYLKGDLFLMIAYDSWSDIRLDFEDIRVETGISYKFF